MTAGTARGAPAGGAAVSQRLARGRLVAVVLASTLARPAAAEPCATADVSPRKVVRITGYPSFFFRAYPISEAIAYIRAGSEDTRYRGLSNYRVDMNEPDDHVREMMITGFLDPVPTPDEKWMIRPMTMWGGGIAFDSIEFERRQAAARASDRTSNAVREPLFVDRTLDGVYPSTALLRSSGGVRTYRVIVEQRAASSGLFFRDYRATDRPGTTPAISPVGTAKRLCANLSPADGDLPFYTPMLSKDGKRLSASDRKTRTTKIYDVDEDGSCRERLDLGMPTGKADFSFDGRRIAFHVDEHHHEPTAFFSGVADRLAKDVVVVDLRETGDRLEAASIRRLTTARRLGDGSYYPSFRADGSIVYLQQEGDYFRFVLVDPDQAPRVPFTRVSGCDPISTRDFAALAALGALWSVTCRGAEPADGTEAARLALGLDPIGCRELVRAEKGRVRNRAPRVTEADLLAACPTTGPGPAPVPSIVGARKPVIANARDLVQARCQGCHNGGGHPLNFDALTQEQAYAALSRVARGDARVKPIAGDTTAPMPLGTRLSAQEIDAINGFLAERIAVLSPRR